MLKKKKSFSGFLMRLVGLMLNPLFVRVIYMMNRGVFVEILISLVGSSVTIKDEYAKV